ncbi:two-component sensor histidine kinase [Clostridium thermosuccinogenes]|uniref:histidine kinase n=1 Tax=Clostridium thermosuccinogenes TaxID=84032 RepID=A0A2K2F8U6_9CLOT|nr:ATP-binding protein [Pseudoclostridium thermosuccinogenes]AUS97388.1 two-component sensor histidine kinase [Pseudoclostridium thermosuccinogenes]PNT95222.1 two-component sensor histidine kinase [Pseudoclostridium thermosuccinogenes]PNT96134.1 two-component sensor histidine kinase [Pseudoclostridium thermosuccinogenes]
MKYSLRTKLSLSYISVVLISVLMISVITNLLLDKHFKDYIIENQERKNKEIVSQINQQYKTGGEWDTEAIGNICINALEQGMIIKLVDSSEKIIWDAKFHDNALCEQMLAHIAKNMSSRYPNWEGRYVENIYPITNKLSEVGKVVIGYYGPYYFNDSDLEFINTINRLLMGVGAFSLILSFLFGSVMAKRLSTPISRVIATAQMISKGYFDGRITEPSSTKETTQLTETINNLAETLENQEVLRKRLTADVAHELRTPLATLQSHMEAMIDGIWKPDTERLKSCHEEIMRINRLVGDLEKLAKYESENLILTKTSFDISELIRHIIQNFENDFANKDIDVKFIGEKEIVTADKDKISQVIINLLSNAQKYTPQGGVVEVIVKGADDVTEITVKDTGKGIPPEDLPHIFERFYRADKSRNRLTGGAGIGLTITKAIIDAHKGKIQVKSKVDEGTEFIISLPKQLG